MLTVGRRTTAAVAVCWWRLRPWRATIPRAHPIRLTLMCIVQNKFEVRYRNVYLNATPGSYKSKHDCCLGVRWELRKLKHHFLSSLGVNVYDPVSHRESKQEWKGTKVNKVYGESPEALPFANGSRILLGIHECRRVEKCDLPLRPTVLTDFSELTDMHVGDGVDAGGSFLKTLQGIDSHFVAGSWILSLGLLLAWYNLTRWQRSQLEPASPPFRFSIRFFPSVWALDFWAVFIFFIGAIIEVNSLYTDIPEANLQHSGIYSAYMFFALVGICTVRGMALPPASKEAAFLVAIALEWISIKNHHLPSPLHNAVHMCFLYGISFGVIGGFSVLVQNASVRPASPHFPPMSCSVLPGLLICFSLILQGTWNIQITTILQPPWINAWNLYNPKHVLLIMSYWCFHAIFATALLFVLVLVTERVVKSKLRKYNTAFQNEKEPLLSYRHDEIKAPIGEESKRSRLDPDSPPFRFCVRFIPGVRVLDYWFLVAISITGMILEVTMNPTEQETAMQHVGMYAAFVFFALVVIFMEKGVALPPGSQETVFVMALFLELIGTSCHQSEFPVENTSIFPEKRIDNTSKLVSNGYIPDCTSKFWEKWSRIVFFFFNVHAIIDAALVFVLVRVTERSQKSQPTNYKPEVQDDEEPLLNTSQSERKASIGWEAKA
ncbi:unnamed protein product [Darwinula stevensoni]|uniref:Uncharacterized protein n=1 Tax=Darwinula stevensoni TaxID=69355 RepID=A0A7R9A837_9CRUS|nr:unnamed protein product [Darwinula stevensoni]CAG0895049.1 unnamed protein product [Darwinula stevensoni]